MEHGQLRSDAVDGGGSGSDVVQICLMEHEGIVVKPEKMSRVRGFFDSEQIVPIARGLRCIGVDPFENCASGELALENVSLRNLQGRI